MTIEIGNAVDFKDLAILIATLGGTFSAMSWVIFSLRNVVGRVSHIEISQARIETKLDMLIKNQERNYATT